jgi:uncharacterized protein (TIGR02598 family)
MNTPPRLRAAFSLIEVTLAIAIVAFGFIAVFGLLPVGLNTFRNAKTVSVSNQVAQQLLTEYEQMDWLTLTGSGAATVGTPYFSTDNPYYFDEQGQRIESDNSNSDGTIMTEQRIIQAQVRVQVGAKLPGWTPSDGANKNIDANTAMVTVQVAFNPTLNPANLATFSSSDPYLGKLWTGAFTSNPANTKAVSVRTYSTYVAKDKLQP